MTTKEERWKKGGMEEGGNDLRKEGIVGDNMRGTGCLGGQENEIKCIEIYFSLKFN